MSTFDPRPELPGSRAPDDRVIRHFIAASSFDECGQTEDAFAELEAGNALYRASLAYDCALDEAIFDALRQAFKHALPLIADSTVPAAPLFIVGLPQTGTTLVEQALAAHPDVVSAGAIEAMPFAVKQLAQTTSPDLLDGGTIEAMAGRSANALGDLYLAHSGQSAAMRWTDSFPLNFLCIGWIVEALPNANIVCTRRGAMDSVWTNFEHLHAAGAMDYPWSHDLMECARYVLMFQRLMGFWRQRFPGRIHEVNYEQFVADREVQTRRLLAHCGLAWDPTCMGGGEPVSGGIGRWRGYERQLGPVMEFFAANGIPLD